MIRRFRFSLRSAFFLAAALAIVLLLWPARRLESENFVFYFPHQHKTISAETIGNALYLPLIPMLNMAGRVTGLQEKRNSLKVWFGGNPLELHKDQTKVQVNKATFFLFQPVRRLNGQWMVPAGFVSAILPRLTGQPILYQSGTARAFVGNVRPISYSARLEPQPSGVKLIVQFTGKVSIGTASTNGKWIIFLGNQPVAPLEQQIHFQNPYVTSLQFDDQDGRPKLVITPAMGNLNFYPQLASDGEELTIALVKPPEAAAKQTKKTAPAAPGAPAGQQAPGQTPGQAGQTAAPGAPAAAPAPPPLPAIVLDAGHGGADSGARSRDGILEKNLTAQLVQKVSAALEATKAYRVILTRNGDADPNFEQRTLTANTARPVAFVTFHAGEMGDRSPVVAVYTYQSPSPSPQPAASKPPFFIPWDWAQSTEVSRSQQLAQDLQQQLGKIQGATAPAPLEAPVRQLRSIAAPAVAVEMGTLSPSQNAGQITQPGFQQQVAAAVAAAIQQFSPGGLKK
ncbi:MAG TPA: N-acetylmuramoyl-L-alanine amidase [Terriglobia bacterium]|nr:N-acetylmuramoyl-L-alanine amidase [Terriglobia bacterium]